MQWAFLASFHEEVSLPSFLTPCADHSLSCSSVEQEGYYIFREMSATAETGGEGDNKARPLKGPNQWPPEALVPG